MDAIQNQLTRRSCRKYRPEQIAPEQLDTILQCATYAPTGRGGQSPVILVVQKPEDVRELEVLNATVMGNPDARPFYGAPTVITVFGDFTVPFAEADANLVLGNIVNAAHAVGVDSCYIWRAREVFDSEAGKALMKKWGVPEGMRGCGNVILGYGEPGGIREAIPRKADYIVRA